MATISPQQEYEQAVIATMAHMTDADIQHWIDRLTAERSQPLYALMVSSSQFDKTRTDLFRYRAELLRRQAVDTPVTLDDVAALVCAQILRTVDEPYRVAAE